jgi:hypothetical integral membrane protein (TIGR02206 family)
MHPIQIFGTTHVAALVATAVGWLGLAWLVKWEHPWSRRAELALAIALLSQWGLRALLAKWQGRFDVLSFLPLHLCDVAAFLAAAALFTKRQSLIDLTFFWGMAGTLQGLLTPNLIFDFPHPEYFGFFLLHSGVVVAALHMTLAWRRFPSQRGLWMAFGWIQLYAIVAAVVNHFSGSNYAFLGARPTQASLMDFLPEPPMHLPALEIIGLGLFWLFYGLLALARRHRPSA